MRDFEYTVPKTLREAVKLLSEKGEAARVLAGGTDLIVQMRARRHQPERVVDVKSIPELNELSFSSRRGLRIGAAVPCHRIYNDEAVKEQFAGLTDAAMIIGGIQIQGRATLGGNLCNASPSADSIPALIAYGAEAEIIGPEGKRKLAVEDFCTGPGANALQPGEILVALRLPMPKANSGAHYLRFIPRNEMDIAVVGAGAAVELGGRSKSRVFKSVRIALAAVAPTPLLATDAGASLVGQPVTEEAIAAAAALAQEAARPISDMRGPAAYRRHLVGVLTKRALIGAVQRANGEYVANAVQANGHPVYQLS
ncbi:MAG: xanthine dehydrogenase family protein subunit M [Gemmatimonadetes bacterium]|nr:xanthine dehydrogenase family protein subunit M [Gemmatimonadota bacterium]MBT6148164.1 xanthine dehydrogenase family protein subunit M [Gemmatimonadota bacterium]MBT7861783.1 xanthine dehydrogenase family protein subunit M [Gemmatimonadota bacterium]